jgi:DNA-binding GntR family transcriptional regulator
MATFLTPVGDLVSREKLAYEKIKEAILTFQLLPGQSLVENELAAQLEISKTPVRDALLQLEKEGLVTRILYKGAYVSGVTPQDMAELYEIRVVIEGYATRIAAPLLTDEEIETAEQIIEEQLKALKEKNNIEVLRLNRCFHDLIVLKCPNQRLKQILANLEDHLKRYRLLSTYQAGRLEKSMPEHFDILKAIKSRDAKAAEEAMKKHLASLENDLINQNFDELVKRIHDNNARRNGR